MFDRLTHLAPLFAVVIAANASAQSPVGPLNPMIVTSERDARDSVAIRRGVRQLTVHLRTAEDTGRVLRAVSVFVFLSAPNGSEGLRHLESDSNGTAVFDALPAELVRLELRRMNYRPLQVDLRIPLRCHASVEAVLERRPGMHQDPPPRMVAAHAKGRTCPPDV